MEPVHKVPFYIRITFVFIGVYALVFILYVGQHIIVPLIYATIISILLNPLVNKLERRGLGKISAISIVLTLTILVMVFLAYIFINQLAVLRSTFPMFRDKLMITESRWIDWGAGHFNVSRSRMEHIFNDLHVEIYSGISLGDTLSGFAQGLILLSLLPVYLFMILYYRSLLLEFIRRVFRTEQHGAVLEVLYSVKGLIQNYLVGIFFEMIIVAILNISALVIIGVEYAILLGIVGAIVNIIPYLGGLIAMLLPMFVALVTEDSSSSALLVLATYAIIQFVDVHYVFPYIVASKVKMNALVSVIVVLIGGAIWGIPGMFLSVPLTAILKVIFDHVESLKPWGFLLGNVVPATTKFILKRPK